MKEMLSLFLVELLSRVGNLLVTHSTTWVEELKLKKKIKDRIKEIKNEKDPRVRAARIADIIDQL
jgi:hypothetical protein